MQAHDLRVGVRVTQRVNGVPVDRRVVAVQTHEEMIADKGVTVRGKKYTVMVAVRYASHAMWVHAGKPRVAKIRQRIETIRHMYPVEKVYYKLEGDKKWSAIPARMPVCVRS